MKTLWIISFFLSSMIGFGQGHPFSINIEILKDIQLKESPNCEIEYSKDALLLKFSRKLLVDNIDLWITNHENDCDTLEYSRSEVQKITEMLLATKKYYSDSSFDKMLEPFSIINIDTNEFSRKDYFALFTANIIFREEIIGKMLENGECLLFSKGLQQKSITKARVSEDWRCITDISTRYFTSNREEIFKCCPCETILGHPIYEKK